MEIATSLCYKTLVNVIAVVNWRAAKNRWRVILCYKISTLMLPWPVSLNTLDFNQFVFRSGVCGQVQNQREGKVSADGERGKVSNIYYWLVLFLLELTKTYRTWMFKLHRIPTTDAEGCINNILLKSTSLLISCSFLRSVAYREFSRLVYGLLGKKRAPLPACAYTVRRMNSQALSLMRKTSFAILLVLQWTWYKHRQ